MNPEMMQSLFAGLTAGIPVGWVTLRKLGQLLVLITRAVEALEKIATRLEKADYVTLTREAAK
jgi:hypothetical protein